MTTVMIASAVGFVLALYLTLAWRMFMARKIWRAGSTMPTARVSAYQMALMNGGVSRVALTGVVRLLGRRALVAGIAGVLTGDNAFRDELDSVEREAMAESTQPAVFKDFLARLEMRLKRCGVAGQLRGELIAMGYMRARGTRAWWSNYAANMLPFAILTAVASASIGMVAMAEDTRHALAVFSVLSAATMLVVALPTRVTALGRYIVWSAIQHHPEFKAARAVHGDALDTKVLGQSVALYGAGSLVGSDMAWIPAVLEHTDVPD